jgi:uncharacterized integral membrane protein
MYIAILLVAALVGALIAMLGGTPYDSYRG